MGIKKYCENKKEFPYLDQAAQETLKKHCWSGNVRELENVILRALVLSNNQDINCWNIADVTTISTILINKYPGKNLFFRFEKSIKNGSNTSLIF